MTKTTKAERPSPDTGRRAVALAAASVALAGGLGLAATAAQAQAWRGKTIRIIVPYTPGGSSSGSAALDRAACQAITRRGRYSPALDQSGNPMRSSSSRRVTWKMPAQ